MLHLISEQTVLFSPMWPLAFNSGTSLRATQNHRAGISAQAVLFVREALLLVLGGKKKKL